MLPKQRTVSDDEKSVIKRQYSCGCHWDSCDNIEARSDCITENNEGIQELLKLSCVLSICDFLFYLKYGKLWNFSPLGPKMAPNFCLNDCDTKHATLLPNVQIQFLTPHPQEMNNLFDSNEFIVQAIESSANKRIKLKCDEMWAPFSFTRYRWNFTLFSPKKRRKNGKEKK